MYNRNKLIENINCIIQQQLNNTDRRLLQLISEMIIKT